MNKRLQDLLQNSKRQGARDFLISFFPGGNLPPPPPPRFFVVFITEIASKWVKCMKLSL